MPSSINIKLASLSSSIKKSFKKVTNELSLNKKNKDGKKEKIFVVANESQTRNEIEIALPAAVVVAPFDVEKAKTFLMVSTFGLDEDDEEKDEDEEEEDIFGDVRDFEAEKNAIVSVVPKSIVAAVSERSKLCLYVQLIKTTPKAKGPPRLRSFNPRPSPLRNFVVVAPPAPPVLLTITTPTTGSITTPPPLSPSSSISSIKSSSRSDNDDGPSTPPRNRSPTRSSIVQKRVAEIEARCGRELVF